jgi:cell division protein FtsQ
VTAPSMLRTRVLPAIAAGVVIAALGLASWKGYEAIVNQPIRHVAFAGNAARIAPADLEALAHAIEGATSIAAVREAAKRVPWVREASVRREFPDRVEIAFETHEALARWSDRALVSVRGEIFIAPFTGALPKFRGPDAAAKPMAAEFPGIARAVAPLGAAVTELRVSPRGGWHLVLDSGLELELGRGRGEIVPRIARFVAAWPKLAAGGAETRFVDLRHANGFAIRTANVKK